MDKELANPMGITKHHYEEAYIQEFITYWIYDKMSKSDAYAKTFDCDKPLEQTQRNTLNRWLKKDEVKKWIKKADKSLQLDWLDKRVSALETLHNMGMDEDNSVKDRTGALGKFLDKLDKEENRLKVDFGETKTVNIVQIVQDKLSMITEGSTIQPDLLPIIEGEIDDQ